MNVPKVLKNSNKLLKIYAKSGDGTVFGNSQMMEVVNIATKSFILDVAVVPDQPLT